VEAALQRVGLCQVTPIAEIGSTSAAIAVALAQRVPVLLPAIVARDLAGVVIRRVRGARFERQFALVFSGRLAQLAPAPRGLAEHVLAWRDVTA
jgi:hypothetical protein